MTYSDIRRPLTPSEFDARVRELRRRCPYLSETSGARTKSRNAGAGGKPESKHVLGMAQDFVADGGATTRSQRHREAARVARDLGFWVEVHDVGSGDHVHVQGLAPGEVPAEWIKQHATEHGFA